MVFIFQFVNLVYHIDSFANIDESLHLLDKAHLVRILLRIFASVFISEVHQTSLVAQTVKGLSTIRET